VQPAQWQLSQARAVLSQEMPELEELFPTLLMRRPSWRVILSVFGGVPPRFSSTSHDKVHRSATW